MLVRTANAENQAHEVFTYHTFESEAKLLDIVGELKAVELSDDEDEPSEEETAQIDGDDGSGGQPTKDPDIIKALLPE